MALPSWSELLEKMRPELKGSGPAAQRRRGAMEFAEWAGKERVPFDNDEATVLASFEKTLEVYRKRGGTLNRQGEVAMEMAKELLARARKYVTPPEVEPETKPEPEPTIDTTFTEEPDQMNKNEQQPMEPEEQYEEVMEEVDEDTEMLSEEEEVVEEQPRRGRRPPPVQVQYVQSPPRQRRGPPVEKAAPRSSALKGILPRPEKVRLYKRNEMGKREMIDDFTVDEIGDMKLEQFIREYIDPQFSNDGMDTEYIAYELDPRTGKEKQPPASITIRGEGEQHQSNDPFNTVRKAMGMLQEMQGMAQQPQPQMQKNPMLEMAQQRAAQNGDVSSMMMLMMMERFMGNAQQSNKPNEELLFKILDRLEKVERGETPSRREFAGPPGFAGPPSFGGFPPGFPPPPPFYPPPPPRMEREDRGHEKLLDLAMAKLAQPPPSLADSVKELMALQTLMQPKQGDSSEVASLRAELRAMTEKLAPKSADSLEASLATFEKLTTIAKSVTQQTTGGDTGGFLKNLITPEVGKVIAGIVAAQVQQPPAPQPIVQQLAAPPSIGQQVAQQVAPPSPPPRDPNQPPMPPPKAVADAVKVFQLAQTPEVQAQRFVDVVFAMYTSQDPFYVKLLTPALEDLNKADQSVDFLKAPRRLALLLVNEMNPKMATPDFVDACIAAMANKAGVEKLPDTLISTKGRWTLKNDVVVMLDEVAKPVEEKKEEEKLDEAKLVEVLPEPQPTAPIPLKEAVPVPVPASA